MHVRAGRHTQDRQPPSRRLCNIPHTLFTLYNEKHLNIDKIRSPLLFPSTYDVVGMGAGVRVGVYGASRLEIASDVRVCSYIAESRRREGIANAKRNA